MPKMTLLIRTAGGDTALLIFFGTTCEKTPGGNISAPAAAALRKLLSLPRMEDIKRAEIMAALECRSPPRYSPPSSASP